MRQKEELINELINDTRIVIKTVNDHLMTLSDEVINTKPAFDKWSVLECIQHMNIANKHYYREFEKKLKNANRNNITTFKSGPLGNYFIKMIKPTEDGLIPHKMKTMKIFRPISLLNRDVIAQFINDQDRLIELLELSRNVDLGKIKIKSALGSWLLFKLGDAFQFVIAHNQRHVLQALNTINVIVIVEE